MITYNFATQPNANPLPVSQWTQYAAAYPAGLQVLSGVCLAQYYGAGAETGAVLYTSTPFPSNQLSTITVGTCSGALGGALFPLVRGGSEGCYIASVNGPLGASTVIQIYSVPTTGSPVALGSLWTGLVNYADQVTLSANDNTLTVLLNGQVILTVTDTTYLAGQPGFGIVPSTNLTDNSILAWAGTGTTASASVQTGGTITYLRLDAEYDPVFEPSVALQDLYAVQQAIQTRLLLFQGEWWENLNEGTPMFQEIMGQRVNANSEQIMALALSQRIAGTPYVTGVQNIEIQFDPAARALTYSALAQTSFGPVSVSSSPGASAGLGT